MEIRSVALLTNPLSGKGRAIKAAQAAYQRFIELNVRPKVLMGIDVEDSIALAREAIESGKYDALVVCGGDGLISTALQAQAGTGFPMGIIPAGTGNDHAREYNIPRDPRRAVDVIMQGNAITTDLGLMRANGHEKWFGTIACCGFDALTTERTNHITWPKGALRYVVAALIEFAKLKTLRATITLDDRVLEQDITLVAVGNTKTYGGGKPIAKYADAQDGLFQVTVLGKVGRRDGFLKLIRTMFGFADGLPDVVTYSSQKVLLDLDGTPVYADGDRFAATPVELECVPGAGRYLVPAK